jgi:putative transposase
MIVHSDRGGQYLSHKMKKLIKTFKLKQSGPPRGMSRADDPYDNAWAESFWMGPPSGRLKAEINMPKGRYESPEKLKTVFFEYIDGYYNTRRLHSSLNYLNPVAFKTEYYRQTG